MPLVKDITVRFCSEDCLLFKEKYQDNGRTALQLRVKKTGEPMGTATVNIANVSLAPDEVLIKDYSENEGMLDALIAAKVVERTGRKATSGFTAVDVCRLLV
jgi:hypothetical protein